MNRRDFLWRSGGGLGGVALAALLGEENLLAGAEGKTVGLHHRPRIKRVVQLFMAGAASHIDLFDYKPRLERDHGKSWDPGEKVELFQNGHGATMAAPFAWRRHGKCGKYLSEVVSELGECVDDIAFVHNLVGRTGVHSQATLLQATGFDTPGFPGIGAWIGFGLGTINENLPCYVVLPDRRGYPSNGSKNWHAGFLPAEHQGTVIQVGADEPVQNLFPARESFVTPESDAGAFALLDRLNRRHKIGRAGDSRLEARIHSYELAARMQLSAPDALDISREPDDVLDMYGLKHGVKTFDEKINPIEEMDYFGRKCLIARRLLERGVRFVQIWSGNDNRHPRRNWDSHENIERDHRPLAMGMARGASALIKDLKRRGLLEDTLILWSTEFGRMPCAQDGVGRDHNPFCFTTWMAGGGIRGGTSFGPSDIWGFKPLDREHPTSVHDVHATVLHLLGIDHTRLTFRHNGTDRRLTDVHGRVLREILV
jgi:hypothetical protein